MFNTYPEQVLIFMAEDEINDQSETDAYSFLDNAAAQLEEAMKKMQAMKEDDHKEIETLEEKISQTESEIQAIEIEDADYHKRLEEVKQNLRTTQQKLDQQKAEAEKKRQTAVNILDEQLGKLKTIGENFKARIAELQAKYDKVTEKIIEKESKKKEINRKTDSDIQTIEQTGQDILNRFTTDSKKLEEKTLETQRRIEENRQKCKDLYKKRDEYSLKLKEKELAISGFMDKVSRLTSQEYVPPDQRLEPAPDESEAADLYEEEPEEISDTIAGMEAPDDADVVEHISDLPDPIEDEGESPHLTGIKSELSGYQDQIGLNVEEGVFQSSNEKKQEDGDLSFLNIGDDDLDAVVNIPFEDEHAEADAVLNNVSEQTRVLAEDAAEKVAGPVNGKNDKTDGSYSMIPAKSDEKQNGDVIFLDDGKKHSDTTPIGKIGVVKVKDKSKELPEDASDLEKAVANTRGWKYSTERGLGRASIQYTRQGEDKEPHRMIEYFDMSLISLMLDSAETMLNEAANFPEIIDEEHVVLKEDNIDYLSKKSEEFKKAYVALTGIVETVIRLYAPQLNKVVSEYIQHQEDMDDSILDDAKLDRENSMVLHPDMARKLEQTILKNILKEHQVKNLFQTNIVDVSEGPQYLSEIDLNSLVSNLRDTKKYLEAAPTQEEWKKAVSGVAYILTQNGYEIITP